MMNFNGKRQLETQENQQRILDYLATQEDATAKGIAHALAMAESTVRTYIAILLDTNRVTKQTSGEISLVRR